MTIQRLDLNLARNTAPIIKWIVQAVLGLIGYGFILFLSAGRLDWIWGWALLIVVAAFLAAHPLILIPDQPGAIGRARERHYRQRREKLGQMDYGPGGGRVSDCVLGGGGIGCPLELDGANIIGISHRRLSVMVLGYAVFLWAMASNAFFAEGVRIQQERGHTVAAGGPYRYVRHPGYVGAILSQVATPFLLGSAWALIPTVASAALYVVRTYLEDKTLRKELPGYEEYAQRTRYRLLPGVW